MRTTGLIARKVGMTRMVDDDGQMRAVTLLQLEPTKVTKILTPERDGYHGLQVGYYTKTEKHINKPDLTRMKKAGINDGFTRFKEFRLDDALEGVEVGTAVNLDSFETFEGVTAVDVTGLTKGRGFQGTTRRYNTKTGRQTHGSRFHRRPGSLGQRTTPGRVYKNKNMPGHMGDVQRTIQNLSIVDIDKESGVVALRGSIPGHKQGFVVLKPSVKAKATGGDKGGKK